MDFKRTSIFAASLMCSVMLCAQTREAAVLFSGEGDDFSYLLTENVSVVFYGDNNARICLDGKDATEFVFDKDHPVTAEFKDAFKLIANQDPKSTANHYSTFFTKKGAYKVPETATAYAGVVESVEDTDVLKLADIGHIIHVEEPVILKAIQSDIILMPSCNKDEKGDGNALSGTEEGIASAGDNVYALSYSSAGGVGFYLWEGNAIGANKAYLELSSDVKAFAIEFEGGETTGIGSLTPALSEGEGAIYNMSGMRVNDGYRGIVIKNGKKVYQR